MFVCSKGQFSINKTMSRQIWLFVVAAVFLCNYCWSWFLLSKTQLPEGCGQHPDYILTMRCFKKRIDAIRLFAQTVRWIPFIFGRPETVDSGMILCFAFSNRANSLANPFISGSLQLIKCFVMVYSFFIYVSSSVQRPTVDLSSRCSTSCEFRGRQRGCLQAPLSGGFLSLMIIMCAAQLDVWVSLSLHLAQ